jgi:hypothetical protein
MQPTLKCYHHQFQHRPKAVVRTSEVRQPKRDSIFGENYSVVKVKLSLSLEGVWGVDVQIHAFPTLTLVRGLIIFTPRPPYLRQKVPLTYWIGDRVGPRVRPNTAEEEFFNVTGLEPRLLGRPARNQLLYM